MHKGEDCFIEAECFFDRPFKRPIYQFDQRGKAAATAHLQRNMIRFNPILYRQNKNEFIHQIVAHEVAHLITFAVYGKVRPHGKEWQKIMRSVFSLQAKTTHSLNIEDVQGKLFLYHCLCTEHKLTVRRHNKILKGSQYHCRKCQSKLTLKVI
ncbi:SprT family zinc-dependent metalloprotease [Psychromonas sp. CNPT3]|uniref:SprT family zinc-dependent metalloprotease n=1 Tax=Psychromonas sp. CNPT3 TaxID=314282 RepID=UPI001E627D6D|nr:SprT family zinc-dependent metalloprotease [Psychromonas sp. CNPT3]